MLTVSIMLSKADRNEEEGCLHMWVQVSRILFLLTEKLLSFEDEQEPSSATGTCNSHPGRAAMPSGKCRSTVVEEPWSFQRGNSVHQRYTTPHTTSELLHQPACQWDCYLFHNQMLTKDSAVYLDTESGIKAIDGC